MADSTRLDGQVAIVTGAARGIGRGVAHVLSEAGARVVIGDILDSAQTVGEIVSAGREATGMIADTSSPEDATSLVDLALREYGQVDILVNNAAIDSFNWSDHGSPNAWDLPDELWRRVIDVNLSGVFYCSKAALAPMMAAGSGCIINMSSVSAVLGSKTIPPAYSASKAGVIGLTLAMSTHLADRGVRVNAIMPNLVESREFGWSEEERADRERQYPLGIAKPRDVAEAVLYLASPAARVVSGTVLQLSGGYQRGATLV